MTAATPRAMSFAVGRVAEATDSGRWRWEVRSLPDRTVLRGGQIAGDRAKAERAARAAIALMGGTVPPSDAAEDIREIDAPPGPGRPRVWRAR